jgi:hypothetical protein
MRYCRIPEPFRIATGGTRHPLMKKGYLTKKIPTTVFKRIKKN